MAARQPQFSPSQIAEALGVGESSVKRWCDQGAVRTIRTLGGHRRITLDALQQFLTSGNRQLLNPQVLGLPSLSQSRSITIPGEQSEDQSRFRQALAAGDEETCRKILQEHSGALTCSELVERFVTDAMHGIGEAWSCDTVDAYQERRGCDICLRLVNELRAGLSPLPKTAPIAIGGAPEGDPYQLPTVLVELALREAGWNATSLGNDLPIDSFLQAAHDYQPQMFWLSVSTVCDSAQFASEHNRLADALGESIPLLIGGRALTDTLRPMLRFTAHCDSLAHLVDLATMMRLRVRN